MYLFLDRGEGWEKERQEDHHCVVASHVAPTGDLACNLGMCPDWESNQQTFGSWPALNPLSYTNQGSSLLLHSSKLWYLNLMVDGGVGSPVLKAVFELWADNCENLFLKHVSYLHRF